MPLIRRLHDVFGVTNSILNIVRISLNNKCIGLNKVDVKKWQEFQDRENKINEITRNKDSVLDKQIINDQEQFKRDDTHEAQKILEKEAETLASENKFSSDEGVNSSEKDSNRTKKVIENEIVNTQTENVNEPINKIDGVKLELPFNAKEEETDILKKDHIYETKENKEELKGEVSLEKDLDNTSVDDNQSEQKKDTQKQFVEVKVPTSKIGRLFQYGGLAASLGAGMLTETLKRSVGLSKSEVGESSMWSESNVKRLVSRLTKMRGAAQKLGQVLSIQDANVLPPQIEKILFQIQHSGAYMPNSQLMDLMQKELGNNWEEKFETFEMTPFAAASIGQVHWASIKNETTNDVQNVAVKVQYPGVATAIDSDLDSLKLLLYTSKLLPRGLYLDRTIQVTRRELRWETDYLREAHYAKKFKESLEGDPSFMVPKIYDSLTSKMVLTMERLPGLPLNQILDSQQETRNWIASKLMELCLRELFEFKFMQTDPNWTNFLYDSKSHKIGLLDFGATREFDDEFLSDYLNVLKAGAENDKEGCLKYSLKLGYLTGDEHKTMQDAHIKSILTLAEPFQLHDKPYDFADQTITKRVRELIPVMLNLRLTPPPEPTYSLHRKLSGAFLLCSRLKAKVDCRSLFYDIIRKYNP